MIQVNVHEAKTNLSRLLTRVGSGEEVVIAKSGNPIARMLPYNEPKSSVNLVGCGISQNHWRF